MTFNPNEHLVKLKGKDYLEVKYRIVWFRDEWPNGVIESQHVEISDKHAIFKATVTAIDLDGKTCGTATDYGSETQKDFGDFIEKASTKAIGRALAALGYGTAFAPELEEGDRIVDAPVTPRAQRPPQAAQRLQDAPQPTNGTPATPHTGDEATERAMKRAHAVAAKHGITHDGLRQLAQMKAKRDGVTITSLSQASAILLTEIADGIEAKPDDTRTWLAKQAELLPGVELTVSDTAGKYTN